MDKFVRILSIFLGLAVLNGVSAVELVLSKDSDVVGQTRVVVAEYEDTFIKLARQYNLGFEELTQAIPTVDPWLPGEGTEIVLPTHFVLPKTPRQGIVINLPELRLY